MRALGVALLAAAGAAILTAPAAAVVMGVDLGSRDFKASRAHPLHCAHLRVH
jgi:hypothetical protein